MKNSWKDINFVLAVIFALFFAGLSVAFAFYLMMTVDAAIAGELQRMFICLSITVLLAVMEYVFSVLFKRFTLNYASNQMKKIKNGLFASNINGFISKTESNIAMFSTNTDIAYDKYFQSHVLVIFVAAQFIFTVAGMIFLNWILFLVAFCASMLPIVAPAIFAGRVKKTVDVYSKKSKDYIDYVQDSHNGIYEIKSFYAQPFFQQRHDALNENVEKARASNKLSNYMMERASNLLGSFSFIIIIGVGGFLVVQDMMTVGVMIAVIQLVNGMVSPIGSFFTYTGAISSSKKLVSEYFIRVDEEAGVDLPKLENIILLENIVFSYTDSEKMVINGLSASIVKGNSYAIIGESGCGKSTLAKIIAGVLPCNDGGVLFDGIRIEDTNMASYGTRVKYIDQFPHLFNMSIRDNIELGHAEGAYESLLHNLGLGDLLLQGGAESTVGMDLLSGGQKQRVAIARTLNKLPDVLILDEPTANLDLETALSVIKYLCSFEDLTLIVITHSDSKELLGIFDVIIELGC